MAKKNAPSKPVVSNKEKALSTKIKKATASTKSLAGPHTGKTRLADHDEISQKAHEIYLERISKGKPGNSESDWQQALDMLKS